MSTGLTDIVKAAPVADYMLAELPEKLPFLASGAATLDFEQIAKEGGDFITVPKLSFDTVASEKNDGTETSTPGKIYSYKDIAAVAHRKRVRGVDNVVKAALGTGQADVIARAIVSTAAPYWGLEMTRSTVNVLAGLFKTSGPLATSHKKINANTSAGAVLPASSAKLIETMAMLGDSMNDFAGAVMHSKVFSDLLNESNAKAAFVPMAGGQLQAVWMGKPVYLSDLCYASGTDKYKIYHTYLFRPGALFYSWQRDIETLYGLEARFPREILTQTADYAVHVRGVKWGVTTTNPADSDYATVGNWATCVLEGTSTAIDRRLIGVACLESNASVAP